MKTIILTLALAASTLAALAQGRISIANDAGRLFEFGLVTFGEPAGPIPGTPLASGRTLVLALYAGTASGSMSLQTSYALTGANYLAPGRGATKPMTLTGIPGGVPQYFNIILTDSGAMLPNSINGNLYPRNAIDTTDAFALYSLSGAYYYGSSGLFQFTPTTSAIAAPAINGTGSTWLTGSVYIGTLIPEPTSLAISGLGAVSLLLFHRRK